MSRRIAVLLVLLATSACASASQNTAARVPATSPSVPSAVSHEHAMIGDATGDSGEGGGKEETDRLVIKNNRFIPQPFAVAQDYGLIIVNEDDVTHNVTIIGPGTPLSVNIGPGKTYDSIEQLHRPAGHYVMYDKLHPELRGTMAVSLRMMIVERRGY